MGLQEVDSIIMSRDVKMFVIPLIQIIERQFSFIKHDGERVRIRDFTQTLYA